VIPSLFGSEPAGDDLEVAPRVLNGASLELSEVHGDVLLSRHHLPESGIAQHPQPGDGNSGAGKNRLPLANRNALPPNRSDSVAFAVSR